MRSDCAPKKRTSRTTGLSTNSRTPAGGEPLARVSAKRTSTLNIHPARPAHRTCVTAQRSRSGVRRDASSSRRARVSPTPISKSSSQAAADSSDHVGDAATSLVTARWRRRYTWHRYAPDSTARPSPTHTSAATPESHPTSSASTVEANNAVEDRRRRISMRLPARSPSRISARTSALRSARSSDRPSDSSLADGSATNGTVGIERRALARISGRGSSTFAVTTQRPPWQSLSPGCMKHPPAWFEEQM